MATQEQLARQLQREFDARSEAVRRLRERTRIAEERSYASSTVYGNAFIKQGLGSLTDEIRDRLQRISQGWVSDKAQAVAPIKNCDPAILALITAKGVLDVLGVMQNITEIEDLVKLISKLPGLGPKSAKRIVLKLINNRDEIIKPMANTLAQVYKNVTRCNSCGSLKSTNEGCVNCENVKEKYNKICVVEDIADQWSIENSNIYKGYYHILGGTLASAGHRKEDLLINSLVERVVKDKIEEVILATSATVEGQTTAYYIQDSLKKTNAKITKLAQGLPVGGEIESLDDGTLFSAFKNRSNLNSNSE